MALELKAKGGKELPENVSRILVQTSTARAFRQLSRMAKKTQNDLLEEMIRRYIKAERLPIEVVQR